MDATPPIHLRPAAELAERVLLPGDPHRALSVAQAVLEKPLMFNHARGLWGYSGTAADGKPLTVQSTGMGGPSAAIVVEELIGLGARSLLRIGTCGSLSPELGLGTLVTAHEVVASDGASAAMGAGPRLTPDPRLTQALIEAGAPAVTAVSTDLFYDRRDGKEDEWRAGGIDVVEMEAASLLAVSARKGVAAAILLAVSDVVAAGSRHRIDPATLEQAGVALGQAGYAALAATAA